MKVKLLKDVVNKDRNGNDVGVQVVRRKGKPTIAYVAGAIIECSDATAAKYIERGLAEEYKEPSKEEEGKQEAE